jgi:hypothetical protein
MRHQEIKELIPLLVYDELDQDERFLLEQHLETCEECRAESAELKQALSLAGKPLEVDDRTLAEVRRELRLRLAMAREASRASWLSGWQWSRLVPRLQTAVAGVVCLVIGLTAGYFVYRGQPTPGAVTLAPDGRGPVSIGNVRFIDADPSDGQVEFTYDTVEPMRYRGSVNDRRAREVLSAALVDGQNPGIRLRAADLLTDERLKRPDADVKRALITAVKMDENNGVRKQALQALLNFPFDNDIRDALLFVLSNDPNPALRIAAINGIKTERYRDPEVLRVLENRGRTDGNEYIRLRSGAILEEVTGR